MSTPDDYDSLTPEERRVRDEQDRAREALEQAGIVHLYLIFCISVLFPALPYKWTQELGDLDIVVPVPKGTRGKDLVIVIQKHKLSVGLKGQEKILEGELCKEIKVDDSTWTLGSC